MMLIIAKLQAEFYNNINDYKHLMNKMMEDQEVSLKASQRELQNMLALTERFKEKLKKEETLTNEIEGLKSSAQRKMIYRALLSIHKKWMIDFMTVHSQSNL